MSEQSDITRKFVFQGLDIRGELVHLDRSFFEINAIHQYAPGVAQLLGEFLAAAVLLSTTIKFKGRLILQAQSNGEIPLLMAECSHDLEVRGIARGAEHATALEFASLLGGGHLSITIEPLKGKRYQGIVSLDGANLSGCIESYFKNSEQLATRLWLACDGATATGLLLQQLPAQEVPEPEPRASQWEHVCTLAETVTDQELIQVSQENLLLRLFHEDPLILFDSRRVQFACSCSRERCQRALSSLGEAELRELLQEQQPIDIECEFCNQHYEFRAIDFDLADSAPEPDALH
jgi:molecular chaperone Hsp33